MKKTIIALSLLYSSTVFAASVTELMNLSNQQRSEINQIREQRKIEQVEQKQQIESQQIEAKQQLAQEQFNQIIKPQEKQSQNKSYNQATRQNYAVMDYSQFAVNPQNAIPRNEKETQEMEARENRTSYNSQARLDQAARVQQHNMQETMSEFEKIQQQVKDMPNPFPQIQQ